MARTGGRVDHGDTSDGFEMLESLDDIAVRRTL